MPIKFEDGGSLALINLKLLKMSDPDMRKMLEFIGSEVQAQTVTRIQDPKKEGPDGSQWKKWSREYAASQHGRTGSHDPHPGSLREGGNHSLLQLDGGLVTSIDFDVSGHDEVLIGSNLDYARAMNDTRQYLGLSSQNVRDIEQLVVDFFEVLLS